MLKINANSTDAMSSHDILLDIWRQALIIGEVSGLVLETDISFSRATSCYEAPIEINREKIIEATPEM